MGSLRVALLLSFFAVLSAPKGAPEGLCEEGKDCNNGSILNVCEGGNGSLDLRLNMTEQILVCKRDSLTDKQEELFLGHLGSLQRLTDGTAISLTSRTFTVQNAKRTDEGIYSTALLNEGTILAVVNLTLDDMVLRIAYSIVAAVFGIFFIWFLVAAAVSLYKSA